MRKLVFTLLIVLSLATMGLGYAFWTDQLTIGATAEMGNLDAEFTGTWPGEIDPLSSATVSAAITDENTASMTVGNAYPGYSGWEIYTIKNTGSIPIDITVTKPTDTSPVGWWTGYGPGPWFTFGPATFTDVAPGAIVYLNVYFKVPETLGATEYEFSTFTATFQIDVTQPNA